MSRLRLVMQIAGPLVFAFVILLQPLGRFAGGQDEAALALMHHVLAVAAWMLIWWISEAVPLPVTALLPMLLFPLLGVMTSADIASYYGHEIVYLFLGGFMLALGLEHYRLHLRSALGILHLTGVSPQRLVLGFMLSTALLSMWISNTATTVMMLPMAMSVLELMRKDGDDPSHRRFAVALLLGIAFAANVGGTATLIGTPPNLVFAGYMRNELDYTVSFGRWMLVALPIATVLFVMIYGVLTYVLFPMTTFRLESAGDLIEKEREKLGGMKFGEWMMLSVFLVTAGLWVSRELIVWAVPELKLSDTLIALFAVVLLFVLPADRQYSRPLLTWGLTSKLPWGILLLFGGGLCLAAGLSKAGIIASIADTVSDQWPYWLIVLLLTAIALYLTEVMSNVALVGVFVPVLVVIAAKLDVDPLYLAIPATLASSCAFMLPMATPPNAIVYASGKITVQQMFLAGFVLNLGSLILIVVLTQLLIPLAFGK